MIIKLTLQQAEFLKSHSTKIDDGENTWYHIPFWFKEINDNLFEVVDEPLKTNKEENVYKFNVNHGEDKQECYSKTESELTEPEKDLLLAEMIQIWGKNPKENKFRFSQMIIKS